MIRIQFLQAKALPDARIHPNGTISKLFLNRNIKTFHEAAEYVHQLPYGVNSIPGNSSIVLHEGFGTCTTKHGLIARLAEELSLHVHRCEGFYELTDAIVTGVDDILKEYGLPYIPRTHCFLKCANGYVDLTEGNCTGKNGLIESYTEIYQVKAEQTQEEIDQMYRNHYTQICKKDPRFSMIGVDGMLVVLKRCVELNTARCNLTISSK
jgi:hypothetical protein